MNPTQTRNPIQPNPYISDWVLGLGVHPYSITSHLNKYRQVLLTNPKKKDKTINNKFSQVQQKQLNKSKEEDINNKLCLKKRSSLTNSLNKSKEKGHQ